MKIGYDLVSKEFSEKIKIPVIGCGGAGEWEDITNYHLKQSAMGLQLQIFHHIEHSVYLLKNINKKN